MPKTREPNDLLYWHECVKEIELLLDTVAIEAQKEPDMIRLIQKDADTQAYLLRNATVAVYNRGILKMREALLDAIKGGDKDGTDDV